MNDTLEILKFIIEYIYSKVKNFFEEIIFNKNNKTKNKDSINEDKITVWDFSFEWIITLFTQIIIKFIEYLIIC